MDESPEINSITESNNYNENIISFFLMEQDNILVLFYISNDCSNCYSKVIYDTSLGNKVEEKTDPNVEKAPDNVMFLKGLWLKGNYAAFIFFLSDIGYGDSDADFEGRLNISQYDSVNRKFDYLQKIEFGDNGMNIDLLTNEFIKI